MNKSSYIYRYLNRYGRTALMMASQKNHHEVIETLLENGADVDAKNEWGATSLMLASKKGCDPVVAILGKTKYTIRFYRK
jgi:serine/threonine-protein phosphatase 6 regulatory ankyrin repeat subunit B